ncbi:hypothetical protein CcaverHIS002_0303330 [Cutaneotrichosporon cavernicola]|nr:hypothetical protein CcaverHIS002_0303330 [Cutaneotrichosporon cavernicola]
MDQPVVQTSHGTVLGTTTDGITRFLGIPYADAERFESPTPTSWEGELDATLFGPPSPQRPYPNRLGDLLAPVPGLPSECRDDILRLNIWAPLRLPSSSPPLSSTSHPSSAPPLSPTSHPVLLWLHGGALERGSPAQPGNSGVAFARNGIVFVSPTYRLGVEGWSSFAPNLGLEDVAAALQWVYNNIGAFGGDPNRISVKGESAGGVLTACLLAKENTLPLISRAIIMSAPLQVEPSCTATRGVAKQLNIPETKEAFMTKSVAQVLDARARQVSIQGR